MTVATGNENALASRPELVPKYFDTELVITPNDNPVYTPAMLNDLLESMRACQQLVPGWVCPARTCRKTSGFASKAIAASPSAARSASNSGPSTWGGLCRRRSGFYCSSNITTPDAG